MKKLILMSLCVLFLSSISVWGAYAVSGQVKDESGNAVNGATVYINCYPGDGTSYSATTTSGQVAGVAGWYSGGWADKNCNGKKIVVKAVDAATGKSGTITFNASGVTDINKDVTISTPPPFAPYAELHCEATPATMIDTAVPVSSTMKLFVQMTAGPILVSGGTATLDYDSTTMNCTGVSSSPGSPFVVGTYSIGTGTVTVEAHTLGSPVPIINGENPTSFFDVFFKAIDVSTPKLSSVEVTSRLYTPGGEKSGFPSVTQNLIGTPHTSSGHFLIDSEEEWEEGLSSGHVHPLVQLEWGDYMDQWNLHKEEGDPYPTNTFKPASLYVYGGGGGGGLNPEDAGLVMAWGELSDPDGSYSSAWEYDYLLDPDLSNSTITVTVTPPQFTPIPPPGVQVNAVSFGIRDINGNIRSWWWSCPAPIPWNGPTTIKIDTSKVGVAAATPVATGFANNPAFNIKNSQFFIVDENFQWIFGQMPVPPPGQPQFGVMWNYWHNLIVTKNTAAHKGIYIKYSQKPDVIDEGQPPMINGWDEPSLYWQHPIMADDWPCNDNRPVTDIHWWGSFVGWTQPHLPPVLPTAFHIGIWTDVPDPDPANPQDYSHPGTLVWENTCKSWVWNFAGYDIDPQQRPERENETCFQFTQLLSEDEWFYQKPDENQVYWLSIAAIYPQGQQMQFPFGWKTRPHFYNDDATRIGMVIDPTGLNIWPPVIGSQWSNGMPIEYPVGTSWDLAFEITTNEPKAPANADLDYSGFVDLADFALFAQQWLTTGTGW
jgi:hypothetical protein